MLRVLLPLWLTVVVGSAGPPQEKAAAPPAVSFPAQQGKVPAPPPQQVVAEMTPEQAKSPAVSRMQTSIEKQLSAVRKQVSGYIAVGESQPTDTFLLPWPKPAVPATNISYHQEFAPCEPMTEPDLERLVNDAAARQKVSPKLVRAIVAQESGGRPCAVSHAGAQGLMQLMPEVQREFAVSDPFDARQSVEAGTKLLKILIDRYAGDLPKALAAYNAGPAAVDRASGIPPIPETIAYVDKVIKRGR